jgi:hypothetical protein
VQRQRLGHSHVCSRYLRFHERLLHSTAQNFVLNDQPLALTTAARLKYTRVLAVLVCDCHIAEADVLVKAAGARRAVLQFCT